MEEGKKMVAHCSSCVGEEKMGICIKKGKWRACRGVLYLVYPFLKVKMVQITRPCPCLIYCFVHLLSCMGCTCSQDFESSSELVEQWC